MSETAELMTAEQVRAEVAPVVARAGEIVIATPQDYTGAADFLKAVKRAQKRVTEFFGPMKAAAHAAWKEVTGKESDTLKPLADAEATVKRKMIVYSQEQERIRQEEQRKLQAEADERARREREKAEAAARLQREKEAAARAEQERQEALARQARNEVERQKAAAAAEAARKIAEAAAAKAEVKEDTAAAVVAPVVEVAAVTPEVKGQSIRKTWKARIVDPKAAATAVLAWPDWNAYLTLEAGEFNRFAARTKGAVSVPGVEFYEDATMASGSR